MFQFYYWFLLIRYCCLIKVVQYANYQAINAFCLTRVLAPIQKIFCFLIAEEKIRLLVKIDFLAEYKLMKLLFQNAFNIKLS
jgi:hypothetical protein